MLVRITNHNSRETFPTHAGPIYFRRGKPEVRDISQRLIDDLKRYAKMHIEVLERPVDFSKIKINDLRAAARKAGVERVSFLKKEELIKQLEESHGKHTVSKG
jgi:hypothetical protein